MLKIVNDPIFIFADFINRTFPSEEEVLLILVDEDLEKEFGLLDSFSLIDKNFETQSLGLRLKNLRMLKGWSQKELASILGVSISTVGRWENSCILTTSATERIYGLFDMAREDSFLGRYWRQSEEPHVILVSNNLSIVDTISVLSHEFTHHLFWDDIMLNMTDQEVHDMPGFSEKWEEISKSCYDYMAEIGTLYGLVEKEE